MNERYDAVVDPYCYPDSTVLINRRGLTDQDALDAFESVITAQRSDEPLPPGRLSATHYCAIHRHLFGDVYAWAGRYRTIRISKADNMFCYPENIPKEMNALFGTLKQARYFKALEAPAYIEALAHFLADLNALHPFREGNGRTQMTFVSLLSHNARHPMDLDRLNPARFLPAMIASFAGDEMPLRQELEILIVG